MTDHEAVRRWVDAYAAAWRAPGTAALADVFTQDARYLHSPYEEPVTGLEAIGLPRRRAAGRYYAR